MFKLLVGLIVILLGGLLFTYGIYYAWISITPGIDKLCIPKYKNLSSWFMISSYACFASGGLLIFLSLKQK
jgi:hypothetical protein